MKKVADLQPGDLIRVEYGDYGNLVTFSVDSVKDYKGRALVACHAGYVQTELVMDKDSEVEEVTV